MDKYGQQWTTTRSAKGISVFYLYLYIYFFSLTLFHLESIVEFPVFWKNK